MNQTMPMNMNPVKNKERNDTSAGKDDQTARRAHTIESRAVPEDNKSDLMENSTTAQNARWMKDAQNKGRGINPSKSPDRYHINENLVVNLADPIKKPTDLQIRMNQT